MLCTKQKGPRVLYEDYMFGKAAARAQAIVPICEMHQLRHDEAFVEELSCCEDATTHAPAAVC